MGGKMKSKDRFRAPSFHTLILFLLLTGALQSFGQNGRFSQLPLNFDLPVQNGSPITITQIYRDEDAYTYWIENVGDKPISSYVMRAVGDRGHAGDVTTTLLGKQKFQPGSLRSEAIGIERSNFAEDETVSLLIDLVSFTDGSTWGPDTVHRSQFIAGFYAGRKSAVSDLKAWADQDWNRLISVLNSDLNAMRVPISDNTQTPEWQGGFRRGYKDMIRRLAEVKDQGRDIITAKLESLTR
jgi:hypothetical protein